MKGLVFTSFTAFIEEEFGPAYLEHLLDSVELESGAAYTNVGTYPHQELLAMLTFIQADQDVDMTQMVESFGAYTFNVLEQHYGELLRNYRNSFECIYHVDQTIHKSVRKIHPDAELPNMNATWVDPGKTMTLEYRSSRPLMHFAKGLIDGCVAYYGDHVGLTMTDLSDGAGTHALFELRNHGQES